MPSIEQCEVASGSVAALPSTLDFFDKFKCISSISENGKDSDSEESFHLPLDDDDMENLSVVSNGRDKEIHNEETEDDILNKFETVPSGTPDHIDSHIEDSILEDENFTDKESDSKETPLNNKEKLSKGDVNEDQKCKDNLKTNSETKPHIEETSRNRVEIKLTYDFGEYEDSGDGEFKSIYETDDLSSEAAVEEPQAESTQSAEAVEPMEIAEEPESVECPSGESKEPTNLKKAFQKVEEILDNFEDSMEVEQEDTNQDIADIIEKLGDQDAPMEDAETLNDEGDVNMADSCKGTALASKKIAESAKDIPEKEAEVIEENTEDVEMAGDPTNEEPRENWKENVDQVGINESSEVGATFQEPLEVSTDATEACSGEAQAQNDISIIEKCSDNETPGLATEEKADTKENENILEDRTCSSDDKKSEKLVETQDLIEKQDPGKSDNLIEGKSDNLIKSKSPVENDNLVESKDTVGSDNRIESQDAVEDDLIDSEDSVESKKELGKPDLEESSEILQEEPPKTNIPEEEGGSIEQSDDDNTEMVDGLKPETYRDNSTRILIDNVEDDDLLKELDKTINEREADKEVEKAPENYKTSENTVIEASKRSETHETTVSKDEDIFKAPIEVPKGCEEKEALDLQNDKSNDKTDEDESDLLDISMVRETEEDDACAIADALNDKDAQVSEKSDEEQSEKVETEQEGSDFDKDNDQEPIDFDDTDDDSHVDGMDHEDSSNAESTRDKVINISESSKDSVGESEPKKRKKSVDSFTDASNDCVPVEASASESGEEQDKMDVPDSLVPDTSLNLESTVVQDEAVPTVTENEDSIPPAPSKKETEGKDQESGKTDKSTEKDEESPMVEKGPEDDSLPVLSKPTENTSARRKSPLNKRTFSASDIEDAEISAKKPKLAATVAAQREPVEKTPVSTKKPVEKEAAAKDATTANEKVKTLTEFSKFMQCRQFTAKLSRSDLEQFCIQKICESLMMKSSEGEMHQTIKKHEKTIDYLRKDMQQLTKQCKDLEIVNKKLMNELRNQNSQKKPLVPLKITRSVGLQVRLNPGNETPNQNRRRQLNTGTTPQKQAVSSTNATVNRAKVTTGSVQQPTVVRQVLQSSPQKSPLTTGQPTTNNATPPNPLLSQALQQQKPRQAQAVAAKRTTPVRKTPEAPKPGNPGVIDLTDEDDRLAATKTVAGSTIKILNKTVSPAGTPNKGLLGKLVPGKNVANQGKQVGVQKTVTVGQNKTALSQGIRLTPASVITTNANGSPQMVYVVPTITSNAGGTQKVAFVNFQPTNGVLSGTLNGSTVSVMSNKGQTLTLKTVPSSMRHKHPASLPAPPRVNADPKLKPLLPKPHLTIKKIDTGIILQWKMPYNLEQYESIASYQLYAYQETSSAPSTDMWRKVGDVKALALPMACTLTQFADKNKYYFAVRSVDVHKRIGAFSDPEEISL